MKFYLSILYVLIFSVSAKGQEKLFKVILEDEFTSTQVNLLDKVSNEFITAIQSGQIINIKKFIHNIEGNNLLKNNQKLKDFLVGPTNDNLKSLKTISEMDDLIKVTFSWHKEINQPNSIVINFIPEKFIEKSKSISFLKKQWMKNFFSCQFYWIDGSWFLHKNICFYETDGPIGGDYG